ncbi:MAG TPA: DUF5372 family protein [Solirubrobacteraceae bacterium]
MVTHPFHPLRGRQLEVLSERRSGAGRVYVCDAGGLGWLELAEEATDRGLEPLERPLSFEVLVGLVAVVAMLEGSAGVGR